MRQIFTLPFEKVGLKDVGLVGGKNASLGEMIRELSSKGVRVPSGFVISADAYRYFLKKTGLEKFIRQTLHGLNTRNLADLRKRGRLIRETIDRTTFPTELSSEIIRNYKLLEKRYGQNVDVAVRSSATAEDLPGASFAGEHETYLGIRGPEELLPAVRASMASLFTDRAISYRHDKGFDHFQVALSVGVERMVRSDKGASGVAFTLDTESGFRNVVLINAVWGLGEMIVQGKVTPDEFIVWKQPLLQELSRNISVNPRNNPRKSALVPIIDKRLGLNLKKMVYSSAGRKGLKQTKVVSASPFEKNNFVLSDEEIMTLARWGVLIEEHYSKKNKKWTPMDMEWAKDGRTGELYMVQARPETVHANRDYSKLKEYKLVQSRDGRPPVLVRGASVGSKIAAGKARAILDVKHIGEFQKGEILITDMTDPDWEPIMKIASAIVTDKGGRTSHAAIVSRELGIPAVVGTGSASKKIKTGDEITVDTTSSEGLVFKGLLKFRTSERDLRKIPQPKTKIMLNVAVPESAFEMSFLPNSGVGLAREEFIIASKIGIHPLALLNFKNQPAAIKRAIEKKTTGWRDKIQYYVDNLSFGIAKIAAAFWPQPVIVRFSDFKTNEYRSLLGGGQYEPDEENPMLGWRGASRYYDPKFRQAFHLECQAIRKVREKMGLTNVIPMVPFCRTPEEGRKVLALMAQYGLSRQSPSANRKVDNDKRYAISDMPLKVYIMCEIPSNVLLADEFLEIFDGMSIGSNDLTQLTLGLDRDSGLVSQVANENNPAVKKLIAEIIKKCQARKKYIGICGQAPSDYPEFAEFLVEQGIESISLNPDTVISTTLAIAKKEKAMKT